MRLWLLLVLVLVGCSRGTTTTDAPTAGVAVAAVEEQPTEVATDQMVRVWEENRAAFEQDYLGRTVRVNCAIRAVRKDGWGRWVISTQDAYSGTREHPLSCVLAPGEAAASLSRGDNVWITGKVTMDRERIILTGCRLR